MFNLDWLNVGLKVRQRITYPLKNETKYRKLKIPNKRVKLFGTNKRSPMDAHRDCGLNSGLNKPRGGAGHQWHLQVREDSWQKQPRKKQHEPVREQTHDPHTNSELKDDCKHYPEMHSVLHCLDFHAYHKKLTMRGVKLHWTIIWLVRGKEKTDRERDYTQMYHYFMELSHG